MGLCQRLLPVNSGLKVVASKPAPKLCPIDGQKCIDPHLCMEKCTDVKGIAHIAFDGRTTPANDISAAVPHGPGTRTCPGLKASCSLTHCGQTGQCLYMTSTNKAEISDMAKGKTAAKPHCHFGLFKLGKLQEATIWIGREASISRLCPEDKTPFALVICLIGGAAHEPSWLAEGSHVVAGNEAARELLPGAIFRRSHIQIPYMHINWPDYGVPQLDMAWWDQFMDVLGKVKGHVALFCMGGHGRTGTAASIIACKAGWVDLDVDPVAWLRSIYCDNAVESDAQADYIEAMCPGFKVVVPCGFGGTYWNNSEYKPASSIPTITKGTGPTPAKGKAPIGKTGKDDPTRLSKNRYKKYVKEVRKKHGLTMPTAGELDDGEMVTVRGHVFKWVRPDQQFEYLGVENPAPNADLSPERAEAINTQLNLK